MTVSEKDEWAEKKAHEMNPRCTGGQGGNTPISGDRWHSQKCLSDKAALLEADKRGYERARKEDEALLRQCFAFFGIHCPDWSVTRELESRLGGRS